MFVKSKKQLTNDEIRMIIKDYQLNGETPENQQAINALISQVSNYIYDLGHRRFPVYMSSRDHHDEMYQAGLRGVFEAMRTYNTEMKKEDGDYIRFTTWMFRFVLGEMRAYISQDVEGFSPYFYKYINQIKRIITALENKGIAYTDDDIIAQCALYEIPKKTAVGCLQLIKASNTMSLDKEIDQGENENVSILDVISSDNEDFQDPLTIYEKKEEQNEIQEKLHSVISEDEFEILKLAFLEKKDVAEIAKMYNTQEIRITRIINAATDKLKLAFKGADNNNVQTVSVFSKIFLNADSSDENVDFDSLAM